MEKEIEDLIIYKLFRGEHPRKPLDFDDFGKKIDKKTLYKTLKKLQKEKILIRKSSNRSSKGRWMLDPKTKNLWEKRLR